MKAPLTIEVEFDEDRTDAESLATAMDTLLKTALSIPSVMDDYGPVRFGEFLIRKTHA